MLIKIKDLLLITGYISGNGCEEQTRVCPSRPGLSVVIFVGDTVFWHAFFMAAPTDHSLITR